MSEEMKNRITEYFLGGWNCQSGIGLSAEGLWYTYIDDLPHALIKVQTKTYIYHNSLWRIIRIHAAFCDKGIRWRCFEYIKIKRAMVKHFKGMQSDFTNKKTLSQTMQAAIDALSAKLHGLTSNWVVTTYTWDDIAKGQEDKKDESNPTSK